MINKKIILMLINCYYVSMDNVINRNVDYESEEYFTYFHEEDESIVLIYLSELDCFKRVGVCKCFSLEDISIDVNLAQNELHNQLKITQQRIKDFSQMSLDDRFKRLKCGYEISVGFDPNTFSNIEDEEYFKEVLDSLFSQLDENFAFMYSLHNIIFNFFNKMDLMAENNVIESVSNLESTLHEVLTKRDEDGNTHFLDSLNSIDTRRKISRGALIIRDNDTYLVYIELFRRLINYFSDLCFQLKVMCLDIIKNNLQFVYNFLPVDTALLSHKYRHFIKDGDEYVFIDMSEFESESESESQGIVQTL